MKQLLRTSLDNSDVWVALDQLQELRGTIPPVNWGCVSVARVPAYHAWSPGLSSQNPIYKHQLVGTPLIPALGKWRRENQKFWVITGYTESLRLAWATWDPVSGKHQSEGRLRILFLYRSIAKTQVWLIKSVTAFLQLFSQSLYPEGIPLEWI